MADRGARWFKLFGNWLPILNESDPADVGAALIAALTRMETQEEPKSLTASQRVLYLLFRSEVIESCDRYQAKVKHAQSIANTRKKYNAVQHCGKKKKKKEEEVEEEAEVDDSSSTNVEEEISADCAPASMPDASASSKRCTVDEFLAANPGALPFEVK